MSLSLSSQIESLLFVRTSATSFSWLAGELGVAEGQVREAVDGLEHQLAGRGIQLIRNGDSVMLATHPDMTEQIEKLYTRQIHTELSRAALETLTIILYQGQVAKTDLDYIRGVNSQFMLRNLLIRGLVEKRVNPNDKRKPLYGPTSQTMAFLGIKTLDELPEYDTIAKTLTSALEGLEEPGDA